MKTRRAIAVVLSVLLVVAAVFVWLKREPRTQPVLVSSFTDRGSVAVRIDRFEWTRELPGQLKRMPPTWMVRYPWLLDVWSRMFRETQHVDDGLVWGLVDVTVSSDKPLEPDDIDFRLDYGAYTIGSSQKTFRAEAGRPYMTGTRFQVTDGPLPKALEIEVQGEWIRFPIEVR